MKYLSICSGIEAASVAWEPLGWEACAFSEIEKFPSAVLAHHWPDVPNLGDMTKFDDWNIAPIDILAGGTPCQAFSVAGLRQGLADERGNLSLVFCDLANNFDPEWIVWENVPGVLSSKDNAFGCFLAGLVGADAPLESGGKWANAGVVSGPKRTAAWRILDAQFFGVAQRRRRVFVLASRGSGNFACARALFPIGESVFGDSPPRREARESVAAITANGVGTCGADDNQGQAGHLIPSTGSVSHCLNAGGMGRQDYETETLVTHSLRGEGFDAGEDGTGRGTPLVPVAFSCKDHGADAGEISPTLRSMGHHGSHANAVRRLTPRECERLQGFPDDHTRIPWRGKPADECPDGPRYKAIGNSMAVPVMRWIGERIAMISEGGAS